MSDFYTKGEPREASAAQSMLNDNQWILPEIYADEIAYKPPFTHWAMAVFSLPQGKVTPFTSRLPSAIAFIVLICSSFIFFGKHLKIQNALLICLILLTSFELHRAAITSRVDMMLTSLIVYGLIQLFNWEERKKLKGFPLAIPFILGLATLVKGPVGIVLPLLVAGIYFLVLRYNFLKITSKFLLIVLAALILPAVWYLFAYLTGGKEFLDLVYAENFGRFFGSENLNIQYDLGHRESFGYNFITLAGGFIPWTLFLFISLFGLNYCKKIPNIKTIKQKLSTLSKIELFALLAALIIILFYCIPVSKRSVYLMPAYPFIAVFMARYILYVTEYHPKVGRIFGFIIGFIAFLVVFIAVATVFHKIDPVEITGLFTQHTKTLNDVAATVQNLHFNFLFFILFLFLICTLFILFKNLLKKNHIKVLYATIAVYITLFVALDGTFLPAFKNGVSIKPFAKQIQKKYPLDENNMFVMNNLLEYSNMYGLNFYLKNRFHNFEKEQSPEGYFFVGKESFEKVLKKYGKTYQFRFLEEYMNKNRDGERIIQLYHFMQIKGQEKIIESKEMEKRACEKGSRNHPLIEEQ
jgi:4-amino-4-deoxy-L-arabinose transferase-like glycosyltransferase